MYKTGRWSSAFWDIGYKCRRIFEPKARQYRATTFLMGPDRALPAKMTIALPQPAPAPEPRTPSLVGLETHVLTLHRHFVANVFWLMGGNFHFPSFWGGLSLDMAYVMKYTLLLEYGDKITFCGNWRSLGNSRARFPRTPIRAQT